MEYAALDFEDSVNINHASDLIIYPACLTSHQHLGKSMNCILA